jgi:3alpha(or 20beta)-hydroxysteroid dehydrogenase
MGRLEGKNAIITGAARGMGESHARRFVEEGANVFLTDLSPGGADLAEELGEKASFLTHDVRDPRQWETVVAKGEEAFGPIDVLVNNAGINGALASTTDITEEQYHDVCAVNQHAVFYGMRTVIPSMLRAGGGSIVNVSSIAGLVACVGFPSLGYVGSKFAVRGMTKATAIEFAEQGIRVNSVHPGYIRTPMMVEATDEEGGGAKELIPMRRIAEPVEVSELVVFLASDESSFITATEHTVDGGMLAQ